MITQNTRLLIIEDNTRESQVAQSTADNLGFKDIILAGNLEEALKCVPHVQAVVSDLFFPAGNIPTGAYTQRFLPYYESFKNRYFQKANSGVVLGAVEHSAEVFGVRPKEYVEEIMPRLNTPKAVLKSARDAIYGIKDFDKYQEFLRVLKDVREAANLPLGIIATEQAKERNIPAVIVTSVNHHSHYFEPIMGLVKVPYVDNIVGGNKNWEDGLAKLLRGEN